MERNAASSKWLQLEPRGVGDPMDETGGEGARQPHRTGGAHDEDMLRDGEHTVPNVQPERMRP